MGWRRPRGPGQQRVPQRKRKQGAAGPRCAAGEAHDLAGLNRSPLAMGLLTGKFTASSTLGPDEVRGIAPDWLAYFRDGRPVPLWLDRVAAVREVLRSGGRTLLLILE